MPIEWIWFLFGAAVVIGGSIWLMKKILNKDQ